MQPVEITLPKHTHGDVWEGLEIGPILFNDSQPPYALHSCRLYFRHSISGKIGYKYKSLNPAPDEGVITIVDTNLWHVIIEEKKLPLAIGKWCWDFETIDTNNSARTLYSGILEITAEQSYD